MLSLLVLTPPPIHITTRTSRGRNLTQINGAKGEHRGGRLNRKHSSITVCLRPGDYTSVVSRTVGSVRISCNEDGRMDGNEQINLLRNIHKKHKEAIFL